MQIFTRKHDDSIAAWGESRFLERIRQWLGDVAPPAPSGMGDDCSMTPLDGSNLLTTDSLIHGRHFDDALPAQMAAAKLINRNVSDIAAMGGTCQYALLAGCFPGHTAQAWMEAFVRGIAEAARKQDIRVLGGDLAETREEWMATLTLVGRAEQPLLRTGGAADDSLWVTGALGGSQLGRHASFEPRVREGQFLAASGEVKAAMDLSDGLAKDLPALLSGDLRAELELDRIPIHPDADAYSRQTGRPTLEHAFMDGEDYELLFVLDGRTDPTDWEARWRTALATPVQRIGHLTSGDGKAHVVNAADKSPLDWSHGFQHFQ